MKHTLMNSKTIMLAAAVAVFACSSNINAQQVRVEITNNAPSGGVALTPLWTGFHDGSFDTFDNGAAVSAGLESLAEDGQVPTISSELSAAVAGSVSGAIAVPIPGGGRPILGGETTSQIFNIGSNTFLSYASMVLISNDFFIGNDNALDISSVVNGGGPISFDVGSVYDAGTEVNDFAFSAANGAPFFGLGGGQTGPDQSGPTADTGLVSLVSATGDPFAGFANAALLGPDGVPANFNFNDTGVYTNGIATITISAVAVPEPTSLTALLALGTCGLLRRRR